MELEMYCEFKNLEIRNSKSGGLYYYLTIIQKGKERHLCIFDDKVFENEVDKFKNLAVGTLLKFVCNYNYKNNKGNLFINKVVLWKNN